jgi:hypothetical protein
MRRDDFDGFSDGSFESQNLSFEGKQRNKRSHAQQVPMTPLVSGGENGKMFFADHRQRSNSGVRSNGRPLTSD